MNERYDILIVGGGAAGLAAAVEAARAGASVLVLEKNHVPGRKILSTGAGKCNFSNLKISPAAYHPPAAAFLKKTFSSLPPAEVLSFFKGLGLLWTADEKGRLFPRSLKAQDVVSALLNELSFRGGQVRTLTEVVAVKREKGAFRVDARTAAPQWEKKCGGEKHSFSSGRVLMSAGGACYPRIGGTSGGYSLLRSLGHAVSPLSPALVPLKSKEPFLKDLDGVRTEARLTLKAGGKALCKTAGEILFTSYGISGPAVLDLSRAAVSALGGQPVFVEADLFPEMKTSDLAGLLAERAEVFGGRPFRHFANGLLNEKFIKAAAARCGINRDAPAGPGLDQLAEQLKRFSVSVSAPLGFEEAMVTAGGCALSEIDPSNFSSRKVSGLYICGELLDLDGDSGGYNLHLAWTSGILAGRHAAKSASPAS